MQLVRLDSSDEQAHERIRRVMNDLAAAKERADAWARLPIKFCVYAPEEVTQLGGDER